MPRTLVSIFKLFSKRRDDVLDARYDALRSLPELKRQRQHVSPFTQLPRAV
ncbi:MAG: hypothetical protein H5U24_06310 [Thioclava marina]|uniref:hypothetical protein n=1 Tax=Thioclava marina TaxID=1915077 RepID=UPI0019C9901F|nr:hypothetical protein [Thioclava marina]MBC7145003.1 hypothetical protein [Thioclava marina]